MIIWEVQGFNFKALFIQQKTERKFKSTRLEGKELARSSFCNPF